MPSPDYIPTGSRVRWSCQGYITGFTTYDTQIALLRDAMNRHSDFYNAVPGYHRVWNIGGLKLSFEYEVNVSRAFNRLAEVKGTLEAIARGLGWTLYPAQSAMSVVYYGDDAVAPRQNTQPPNTDGGGGPDPDPENEGPSAATVVLFSALVLLLFLRR